MNKAGIWFMVSFVVAMGAILLLTAHEHKENCLTFQRMYGDIIVIEEEVLWTNCYVTLPSNYLYELSFTIEDHFLIRDILEFRGNE